MPGAHFLRVLGLTPTLLVGCCLSGGLKSHILLPPPPFLCPPCGVHRDRVLVPGPQLLLPTLMQGVPGPQPPSRSEVYALRFLCPDATCQGHRLTCVLSQIAFRSRVPALSLLLVEPHTHTFAREVWVNNGEGPVCLRTGCVW